MNKNNKGFLLIETLITTCIIATLATSMYIYISKTIKNYEKRDNYDNIVDIYKVNNIKNILVNLDEVQSISGSVIVDLEKGSDNNPIENAIYEKLGIEHILVSQNNSGSVKGILQNKTNNASFKEYIRILKFDGDTNDLRIFVSFKKDNKNSFASLAMTNPSA